jgi:hypothetical protein
LQTFFGRLQALFGYILVKPEPVGPVRILLQAAIKCKPWRIATNMLANSLPKGYQVLNVELRYVHCFTCLRFFL